MENKTPLLSVCLITYNHEKFIEQAIESVLMQKVSFLWEFIIADDCSTDNTRNIVKAYAEKYPDKIKLILQEKNVGAAKNWLDLITAPKGKYVAYFEGDDYWTDENKLQKQVDFLEANAGFVICFHNALIDYEDDKSRSYCFHEKGLKTTFSISEVIERIWFMPTASLVFRNILEGIDIQALINWQSGDIPLSILLAAKGNVYYIDQIMSVYRKHSRGVSNEHTIHWEKTCKDRILMYAFLDKYLNYQYSDSFQKVIFSHIEDAQNFSSGDVELLIILYNQYKSLFDKLLIEHSILQKKNALIPKFVFTLFSLIQKIRHKLRIRTRLKRLLGK